jgi:hypothetical protein
MKTIQTIAAVAIFAATNLAFAADAPAASAAVAAAAASVPAVTITNPGPRSRAEVRAEAVEAVKNHKTALAIQLEQYKN